MRDSNIKAMLVSLGGTPNAIIKSLNEYKPEFVVFLVSDQSVIKVDEVKNNTDLKKYKIEITHNPDDLEECFTVAKKAMQLIYDEGYSNENIAVDYTGGTKNMTASLVLASVDFGVFYSYVSGEKRTKNGIGIVIDGTEKVLLKSSPWDLLAENYLRKIKDNYNNYHFYVSFLLAAELSRKASKHFNLFKRLTKLFEGIYLWDEFRYKDANRILNEANPGVIEELSEEYDKSIGKFAHNMKIATGFLKKLVSKSEDGQKYSEEIVIDMIANSLRKAKLGRYNDAILRLYRAVELWTQWKLLTNYNIDTSKVPAEKVALLQKNVKNTLKQNSNGYYEVPLRNSLELLSKLGDEHAQFILSEMKNKFLDLMRTRNYCPLEHNIEPRREKDYRRLYNTTIKITQVEENKTILPQW